MKKLLLLIVFTASFLNAQIMKVKNPLDVPRKDEVVLLDVKKLPAEFHIMCSGEEVPFQVIDKNRVAVLLDFNASEEKHLKFVEGKSNSSFVKRTQAYLGKKTDYVLKDGYYTEGKFAGVESELVPKDHFPHNALYQYEGPGWESDKVGYRFYLDERNRNDIFGKKTSRMVLHEVGRNDLVSDSKESYTKMQEWGQDIFKVGNSLGMGSLGILQNGKVSAISKCDSVRAEISQNGNLLSSVKTNYFGWNTGKKKTDISVVHSITAGSRLTKVDVSLLNKNKVDGELVCGLAKHDNTVFVSSDNKKSKWNYIALWGKQALSGDDLGVFIFYNNEYSSGVTEDELSRIVKLKVKNKIASYYFGAAWVQEENGIKSEKEFRDYLESVRNQLNNPVTAKLQSEKTNSHKVMLDYFYNNEYKNGNRFHYTYEDTTFSGFSELANLFAYNGWQTVISEGRPTKDLLKNTGLFIIVDPDTQAETEKPNYIEKKEIDVLESWVKSGGILLLMANDSANCEFTNLNKLSTGFGISFDGNSVNKVTGKQFEMGKVDQLPDHPLFKGVRKLYMKEVSSISLSGKAKPVLSKEGKVFIASTEYGKGKVIAVGDPWLYNEYIDNRKLPEGFDNLKAAKNLIGWLDELALTY